MGRTCTASTPKSRRLKQCCRHLIAQTRHRTGLHPIGLPDTCCPKKLWANFHYQGPDTAHTCLTHSCMLADSTLLTYRWARLLLAFSSHRHAGILAPYTYESGQPRSLSPLHCREFLARPYIKTRDHPLMQHCCSSVLHFSHGLGLPGLL